MNLSKEEIDFLLSALAVVALNGTADEVRKGLALHDEVKRKLVELRRVMRDSVDAVTS